MSSDFVRTIGCSKAEMITWIAPLRFAFAAGEQRELAPLPVTVDVHEADVAQPLELWVDVEELVRGILVRGRDSDRLKESLVRDDRHRRDVLQIAEHACRLQHRPDFFVQLAL